MDGPDRATRAAAARSLTRDATVNLRLIERLLGQVGRLLSINQLDAITVEVVEAARETPRHRHLITPNRSALYKVEAVALDVVVFVGDVRAVAGHGLPCYGARGVRNPARCVDRRLRHSAVSIAPATREVSPPRLLRERFGRNVGFARGRDATAALAYCFDNPVVGARVDRLRGPPCEEARMPIETTTAPVSSIPSVAWSTGRTAR